MNVIIVHGIGWLSSTDKKLGKSFINENLTPHRAELMCQTNMMKADGFIVSVWTLDRKVYVKASPTGNPIHIYTKHDLDEL